MCKLEFLTCMQPPEVYGIPDPGLPWLWNFVNQTSEMYHPFEKVYVKRTAVSPYPLFSSIIFSSITFSYSISGTRLSVRLSDHLLACNVCSTPSWSLKCLELRHLTNSNKLLKLQTNIIEVE